MRSVKEAGGDGARAPPPSPGDRIPRMLWVCAVNGALKLEFASERAGLGHWAGTHRTWPRQVRSDARRAPPVGTSIGPSSAGGFGDGATKKALAPRDQHASERLALAVHLHEDTVSGKR